MRYFSLICEPHFQAHEFHVASVEAQFSSQHTTMSTLTPSRMHSPSLSTTKSPNKTHHTQTNTSHIPFSRVASDGTYMNISVPMEPFQAPKSPQHTTTTPKKRKFVRSRRNVDPKYLHDRLYHTYYRGYLKEFLDEEMDRLVDARVRQSLMRYLRHLKDVSATGASQHGVSQQSETRNNVHEAPEESENDFTTPIAEPRKSSHVPAASRSKVHVIPSARSSKSVSREEILDEERIPAEEPVQHKDDRWDEAASMELTDPDISLEEHDEHVPTKDISSKLSLPPVPSPKKPSSGSNSIDTAHVPLLQTPRLEEDADAVDETLETNIDEDEADDASENDGIPAPETPHLLPPQTSPRKRQNLSSISVQEIQTFLSAKKPKIPTLSANSSELYTEIDTMIEKLSDLTERQGLENKVEELSPIQQQEDNPFEDVEESPTVERDEETRSGGFLNPTSTTTTTTVLEQETTSTVPPPPPLPQEKQSTTPRRHVHFEHITEDVSPIEDVDAAFSPDKVPPIDRSHIADEDEPIEEGENVTARLGPLDEAELSPTHFEHISLTPRDLRSDAPPPPPLLIVESSPPRTSTTHTTPQPQTTSLADKLSQVRLRKTSPHERSTDNRPAPPTQDVPINLDERIQQLIKETGTTLSRNDLVALARVRVPTLARYYEDIARGISKKDAFEEMRKRALMDMLDKERSNPGVSSQNDTAQRDEVETFCERQQPALDQDAHRLQELRTKYQDIASIEPLTRALTEKTEYCGSLVATEQRQLDEAQRILDELRDESTSGHPINSDKIHDSLVRWTELETRRKDGMAKIALEDLEFEELLLEERNNASAQTTSFLDETPSKVVNTPQRTLDAATADSLRLPLSGLKNLQSPALSARSRSARSARSARSGRSARTPRDTPRRHEFDDDMHGVFEPVDESDPLFLSLEQNMSALSQSRLVKAALSSSADGDKEESSSVVRDFSDWKKLAVLIKEHQSQLRDRAKEAKETSDSLLNSFSFRSRSHLTSSDDSDLFRVGFPGAGDDSNVNQSTTAGAAR